MSDVEENTERPPPRESLPLLPIPPGGQHGRQGYSNLGFDSNIKIEKGREYWEDKDWNEDKILFSYDKKRGTSMILYDSLLVILDYLQIFALLQSLALRWPWPEDWLKHTSFVFLFNVDVWEFSKIQHNGTYKNVKHYYTPSTDMPYNYWNLLCAWAAVIFVAVIILVITYIVLNIHKHPFMMVHIANLKRAYIISAEVLALPLGITLARLFHCRPDASVVSDKQLVDISNDIECFGDPHWAYLAPAIVTGFLYYTVFPIWLINKTKQEILAATKDQHEGFLQLKETEYVQGLDMIYIVNGYPLFSSFSLWGVYYRPSLIMFKFSMLIFYGALFQHTFALCVVINVILAVMFIVYAIIRPFRVKPFNFMLVMNYLCLTANCLLGTMLTSFDSYSVQSPWLTPTYMTYIVVFINAVWLICCIGFLLYLVLRHFGCCIKWIKTPLWPSMTSQGLDKLDPYTRKFMRGILRARHLLEKAMSMPPIFAPAHELSRQIQILNAYCREAEFLADPIHPTLWDLLDDMIETHSRIAPKSLFADSVKDSIRQTAAELMKIMPMFVRRLAQREYDFILVHPVKRRLLLKMYCMGLFLNGRSEKIKKEKMNMHAIKRIWRKSSVYHDVEDDDGYYEDMYPEAVLGPNSHRPETAVDLASNSDDEDYMEDVEIWAANHPVSRMSRPGDDVSHMLRDDVSLDLSEMMQGVPSLHGSATNSRPLSRQSITQSRASSSVSQGNRSRPSSSMSQGNRSRPGSSISMGQGKKSLPGNTKDYERSSSASSHKDQVQPNVDDHSDSSGVIPDNGLVLDAVVEDSREDQPSPRLDQEEASNKKTVTT